MLFTVPAPCLAVAPDAKGARLLITGDFQSSGLPVQQPSSQEHFPSGEKLDEIVRM